MPDKCPTTTGQVLKNTWQNMPKYLINKPKGNFLGITHPEAGFAVRCRSVPASAGEDACGFFVRHPL